MTVEPKSTVFLSILIPSNLGELNYQQSTVNIYFVQLFAYMKIVINFVL